MGAGTVCPRTGGYKNSMNICEQLAESEDFTLVVAALTASGLDAVVCDEKFQGTIYAPNDAVTAPHRTPRALGGINCSGPAIADSL